MSTSRVAIITFVDGQSGGSIDNTLPGIPVFPSQGLPSGPPIHPGNALPPPGSIATLPVFPFDPTAPDNSLPGEQPTPTPPIQLRPGLKFKIKWLACSGLILVPDNELPATPEPK